MLVSQILDDAAYERSDNPELLKRGMALRQSLSLFNRVYKEVTMYAPRFLRAYDRWTVPAYIRQLDLTTVNTNLLANNAVTFVGFEKPLDYPGAYVPLKAYNNGQISIVLPTLAVGSTYTFTADVGPAIAGDDLPAGFLIFADGEWEINYLETDVFTDFQSEEALLVGLKYQDVEAIEVVDYFLGDMKLRFSFTTLDVRPTHIIIQMRENYNLGGFKLELGHIGTPSRVGAASDLQDISMFQIGDINVISSDLRQEETMLFGYIPQEFQITHNGKAQGVELTTDLGKIDTELQMALIYGLASALDMANNEGMATPQQQNRMRKAEEYKLRIRNRAMYRKGKLERTLPTWQV